MFKFIIVAALLTAAPDQTNSLCDLKEFAGRLEILDTSLFRSSDGEVYSVRLDGLEAQERVSAEIRRHSMSEMLCLDIRFKGHLLAEEDFAGREIVAVRTLDYLQSVDC